MNKKSWNSNKNEDVFSHKCGKRESVFRMANIYGNLKYLKLVSTSDKKKLTREGRRSDKILVPQRKLRLPDIFPVNPHYEGYIMRNVIICVTTRKSVCEINIYLATKLNPSRQIFRKNVSHRNPACARTSLERRRTEASVKENHYIQQEFFFVY